MWLVLLYRLYLILPVYYMLLKWASLMMTNIFLPLNPSIITVYVWASQSWCSKWPVCVFMCVFAGPFHMDAVWLAFDSLQSVHFTRALYTVEEAGRSRDGVKRGFCSVNLS